MLYCRLQDSRTHCSKWVLYASMMINAHVASHVPRLHSPAFYRTMYKKAGEWTSPNKFNLLSPLSTGSTTADILFCRALKS